jgi:hypothetical protein
MEATLDLWRLPAESATRVGHPAPFPIELPQRLIELYTFKGDLVLDPFMGSGSTLVAARRAGRAYVGYDLDPAYVELARTRVAAVEPDERSASSELSKSSELEVLQLGNREGRSARQFAEDIIAGCGFAITARDAPVRELGLEIGIVAVDQKGKEWFFDVSGGFAASVGGLLRADTLWRTLGRVLLLRQRHKARRPVILLTTDLPQPKSAGERSLHATGCNAIFDVIEMTSAEGHERLRRYATGACSTPAAGFWRDGEISRYDPDAAG